MSKKNKQHWWNFRVVMFADGHTELAEVHYKRTKSGKVKVWAWADASAPYGDTRDELLSELTHMAQAFSRPIINVNDLPGGNS